MFSGSLAWDRHAMRFYLLEDRLYRRGHTDLAFAVSALSRLITGVEVEPGAELDPTVKFLHGQGATIGAGARVGAGTTIFQQVTLGRAGHRMDGGRVPECRPGCLHLRRGEGARARSRSGMGRRWPRTRWS